MALIILGHPNIKDSLANKAIMEEVERNNPQIEIRNIAALYPDYTINVNEEQEALLRHKTIVFQYPIYWYNMPAILKHWFDIVFEYGFAYGKDGNKLKDKNFVPSFTVGGPENAYKTLGDHHFRVYEYCKNLEQTAYYAQMNYIDPIYFHGTSIHAGHTKEDIVSKAKNQANSIIELIKAMG